MLEIVAEMTSGTTSATSMEAGNNTLTAPAACGGRAC